MQYQLGYRLLFIPFIALMLFLSYAYNKVERDHLVTKPSIKEYRSENLSPVFWIYTAFTFFCILGFVNFSIIGYHLKAKNLMTDGSITLLYSIAMLVDAVSALVVGRIYDRLKIRTNLKTGGIFVLMLIPFITLLLPVLTLGKSTVLIVMGMIIFGIIMGTHETVMQSAIADITPFNKRGTGYGVFNTSYGLALLGGSALMGLFYDINKIRVIIGFTWVVEFIAIILYFKMNSIIKNSHDINVNE